MEMIESTYVMPFILAFKRKFSICSFLFLFSRKLFKWSPSWFNLALF